MTPFARVVAVDVPHQVTQRGKRTSVYPCHRGRLQSLHGPIAPEPGTTFPGSTRLLFDVQPRPSHSRSQKGGRPGLGPQGTHGRFAAYWNATRHSTGHVWQGRFYSCPLDEQHLGEALRYTELNPVRAGLVAEAERWEWSSAGAHCGVREAGLLTMNPWQAKWSFADWRAFLSAGDSEPGLAAIRQYPHTGRPLGTAPFTRTLERETQRTLTAQRCGRPRKTIQDDRENSLSFRTSLFPLTAAISGYVASLWDEIN
jgi:putative transposase